MRGNNSDLVKRCLEDRNGDWQEISSKNTLFNFKWSPFSKGIRFDYLTGHGMKKMVNHFEFHDQISEKDNLFINMQRLCENQRKNVFSTLPVTFSVDLSSKLASDELERFQAYFNILEKHKTLPSSEERLSQVNKEITGNHLFNSKMKTYTKFTLCENMFDGNNLWLLKPTDYNRGRGVQVFNSLEQFCRLV
jgi:Tubulin-tyrosine ligase family